ncbi:insecticidal delta-endotoxin Cry8Ea1 family protein [Bacillus toyonensis]|uniref:insecticidal delta-endotoxin Cry8Ea1 family protein n=1 Tax=Bacillus toyonensis TaxID=155322 RepID=UPI000CD84FCD|nr:insecticidal delta-endotoxin Cry8Ea1 family protein [Bacillus toyonensis]MED3542052.1 insecticidal delta-endotoxin Cry8Ea1 family protein [Bacillus toyonensis]MEE2021497.1 insecticidal delta-endotoxin Cry8Ea1 family protein [Bacillus toyonensis]
MNSYQNKNEYEILDTSPNNSTMSTLHPRYPLAKDPYKPMRNTNYKEWLAMCANNNQVPIDPLDNTWAGVMAALFASAAAIAGLMSAVPVFSVVATGTALAAALTPILFPSNGPDVSTQLMSNTEALLKRELDTYVRARADSEFQALEAQREFFKSAFDYWKLYPTNSNAIATVAARFHTVNGAFVTAMRLFRTAGYEALLLPVYAQAARLHLLHLRDGVLFANEWGLAKDPGDLHDQEFNKYAAEYADYCESTYNTELNRIKTAPGKTWLDYNQYRRIMTIAVLDIAAKFSILNPRLYRLPLQEEILTRKIYTDPVNFSPGPSIADDENRYTVPLSLVTQLVNSRLFTNVASAQNAGFIGNQNRYKNIGVGDPVDGPIIGQSVYEKVDAGIPTNEWVYEVGVNGIQNDYPRNIGLRKGSTTAFTDHLAGSQYNLGPLTRVSIPTKDNAPINNTNFTHRLSDIILPGNKGSSFAWTHVDVDPTGNYLSTTKINLIPATKASKIPLSFYLRKGPGFIGGDLVRLGSGFECSYKFNFKSPGSSANFRIRIRYAGAGSGQGADGQVYFKLGNYTSPTTPWGHTGFDYGNVKYNQFRVLELFGTAENITDNDLKIIVWTGSSAQDFYLDRLELIPMTGIPTEYNEPQKLETAKKAVTDLFTN